MCPLYHDEQLAALQVRDKAFHPDHHENGHKNTGSPLAMGPGILCWRGPGGEVGCSHRTKEDERTLDQLALPWPAHH